MMEKREDEESQQCVDMGLLKAEFASASFHQNENKVVIFVNPYFLLAEQWPILTAIARGYEPR